MFAAKSRPGVQRFARSLRSKTYPNVGHLDPSVCNTTYSACRVITTRSASVLDPKNLHSGYDMEKVRKYMNRASELKVIYDVFHPMGDT